MKRTVFSELTVFLIVAIQPWPCRLLLATPPLTEPSILLDSFIPAAMQILAHVTELMKYDLRPTTTPSPPRPGVTTTTTVRPTPSHRPGVYAPSKAPGPEAYHSNQINFSFRDYVNRLQQPSGSNYFSRYPYNPGRSRQLDSSDDNIPVDFYLYFGKAYTDLLRLASRVESNEVPDNVDVQVNEFSKEYDQDPNIRTQLLRQKQVPPTRAYVTLLSLYDMLNKESKKLALNKYQGFSTNVLHDLISSSISTSAYQLRTVLIKIAERQDTKDPNILKKIKQIVNDIDEHESYMNLALRYIPPLAFSA